eukprot:gene2002-2038_t
MKRPRLRDIAIALIALSGAISSLAFVLSHNYADRLVAEKEAEALTSIQQAADTVAVEARNLFRGLDELGRSAALVIRLADIGEPAKTIAAETLAAAAQASPLGVSLIRAQTSSGKVLFEQGSSPFDAFPEPPSIGLSRPVMASNGRVYQRYTVTASDHPDWQISVTIDPLRLTGALERVLPANLSARSPVVATLIRLPDNVLVARSDGIETIVASRPPLYSKIAEVGKQASGATRLISVVTAVDSLVGFRAVADMGLAAVVSATAADMMAFAELATRQWQRAPYAVALICIAMSALTMALITRFRATTALAAEKQKTDAEVAARAELDELVRCSPAMLYRGQLDANGIYSRDYVTPNAKAVTGWDPEMLSDPERVWKLSAAEDRHLRGTNYARALRLGRSSMDYRFLRPDGGYSWLRNEAVIVSRRPDGSAVVAGAITNITRERELAAQAALQSRMATLGQLSTSLAHELTQPVTVIGMGAAIARSLLAQVQGEPIKELTAQIDQILDQTDRAGDMIRHLRSYGHTDSGPLAGVDLEVAVNGAMTLAGMPLREAGVNVQVLLEPGLPPVRARLVQVEQVLVNLMINARDAMRAVPEQSRQLVLSAVGGKTIRLSVADSGPGIEAAAMPRLFEAFYTTKPPGHGTGLGLALCQSMMQSFGGAILVESGPSGATFTLEFQAAS